MILNPRDEAEKYMSRAEKEATEKFNENNKGGPIKKRRVRPIPLTSRIPLYDKLMAAKEERCDMSIHLFLVIFSS